MYYSPFIDKNGNFKTLKDIEYSDLEALKDIDEGYKVEYKSTWDDNVKKAIPKSISSFANTDGGWLFIGVNNDGIVQVIQKQRTDFGQQIGELLKSHVSPSPRFETKFVCSPSNNQQGVLIIRIHTGIEPPYISDGTVYTRTGSSNKPVRIQHSADIDKLYSKRKEHLDAFEKFCDNKIFDNIEFPYCSIYLYNQGINTPYTSDLRGDYEFIENFAKECGFDTWMPSSCISYMFHNSKIIGPYSCTTSLELFRKWHIKLHLPLCTVSPVLSKQIANIVSERQPAFDITSFSAIDGYLTCEIISTTLSKVLEQLVKMDCNLEDYKVKVNISNVKNSFLFFPTKNQEWLNIVCNRFRYSVIKNISIDLPFTFDKKKDFLLNSFIVLSPSIGNAFGYTSGEFGNLYTSSLKVREELLEKKNFSNHEYCTQLEYFFNRYI